MHTSPQPRHRFSGRRAVASFVVAGLVLAACGSDDDEAEEPAATDAPAATEAPAESATEVTEAPVDESATASDMESDMESATASDMESMVETTDGGEAMGGFATMEEIAALCPADIAPDTLVFSTFPGQEVSIDPVTEAFTEATGVDIEWLENSLGDRLTKLATEKGSPTIDVALVPIGSVPNLLEQGVTEATNTGLPNYEQLIDVAKVDGGYGVSVLQFGIAYNPAIVPEPPTSWLDFLDLQYEGLVGVPQMPNSGGNAFLSMLAKIGGGDESDLTPAIDQVAAIKDTFVMFMESSTTVEEQIAAGEIGMYVDIGGVVSRAKLERNLPVEFVVPVEGAPVSMNTLVIPVGSEHTGCAEAFVAFMLGAESQLIWAETLYYGTTSSIVEFPAELAAQLYPVPGDSSSIVPIDWATIAANSDETLDYWNRTVTS